MKMQAAYLCHEDGKVPDRHVGDYPLDPEHPNHGLPDELWEDREFYSLVIEYESETGAAEWWPPQMMGIPPREAPWSHPDAARTMDRMAMLELLSARLREIY